jgi:hypothetical protein
MPCINLVNSSILSPPAPVAGDLQVVYGNVNNSPIYEGMVDYYYEYHYSGLFIDKSLITGIPNGASIYKVAINIENTTNGTYPENEVDIYMANALPSYNQFPSSMRINLTSGTDTQWNNDLFNFTQVSTLANYSYQQVTADPNINWKPEFAFNTTNFTHQAGNNILIMFNGGDGNWVSSGSSNPKHIGQTLSGTQLRRWVFQNKISGPRYSPTEFVNADNTFIPNIQLFWN